MYVEIQRLETVEAEGSGKAASERVWDGASQAGAHPKMARGGRSEQAQAQVSCDAWHASVAWDLLESR